MKITVGVPNYGGTKIEMMMSLIPALFVADYAAKHTIAFDLVCPSGCHNYKNRNKIVVDALQRETDYVFMADTDMEFPDDTLAKLLQANKDIIGVTYNKRSLPITPIHNKTREMMPQHIFQTNVVPTGVILIKTDVFKQMDMPWFAVKWLTGLEFTGPDVYFCQKARTMGFEVWLDPTIEVKHIGECKY